MRPVSKMGFEVHIRNIPTATCMIISSLHLSLSLSVCLPASLCLYLPISLLSVTCVHKYTLMGIYTPKTHAHMLTRVRKKKAHLHKVHIAGLALSLPFSLRIML